MKRTRAILVSTLILLTALLVCTGCSSNKKEASPYVQNFVGTWELSSMVQDGKEVTEQDVEALKQKNYCAYLELNDRGSAALDLFAERTNGTWEAAAEDTAVVTLKDEPYTVTLSEGILSLAMPNASLNFKQIDPSQRLNTYTVSPEEAQAALTERIARQGNTIEELQNASPIDMLIADDEVCSIRATATGVYNNKPAIFFEISNRTDHDFRVINSLDEWKIDYGPYPAVLYQLVPAGASLGTIAWFSTDELDADRELSNVTGSIMVLDPDNSNIEYGHYIFAL